MLYTVEEAKQRIPEMLRRIALSSIETMMCLDKYAITSYEFESRLMAMQGYMSQLWKMYMTICKEPKKMDKVNRKTP